MGLYLTAFYTAQPVRWQSLLVILLPDQVVSSWVGNDWGQFQVLDRLPIVAVAGLILILAYLGGRLSMAAVGCDRDLARLGGFRVLDRGWTCAVVAVDVGHRTGRGPSRPVASPCGDRRHGGLGDLAVEANPRRPRGKKRPGVPRREQRFVQGLTIRRPVTRCLGWSVTDFGSALPFLLLILLGAMLPPWDFDVREYHLQVPKEWYQAGRIGFLPHNVYGNMPLGAEMHALLGMVLMPGERSWWWGALAGKTVIAGFAPLTALGLLAAGRRFVTPGAGVIAALVYLSVPWVVHVSQAGLIEGAVACYLFLAVYGIAIWAGENGGQRAGDHTP